MATYEYTRTLTSGIWDINNPNDVDANGDSVTLAQRIFEDVTLGPLLVGVSLSGVIATIETTVALSGAEETSLTGIVTAHKAANGTIDQSNTFYATSPNGTKYKVFVDNAGVVSTEAE